MSLLLVIIIICVLLSLLQPLNKGLNILQKHITSLGMAALFVPERADAGTAACL